MTVDVQILNLKTLAALEDIAVFWFSRDFEMSILSGALSSLWLFWVQTNRFIQGLISEMFGIIFLILAQYETILSTMKLQHTFIVNEAFIILFSAKVTHVRLTKITFELVGFMFSFIFGYH